MSYTVSSIVFGLLIVSAILVGTSLFYADLNTNYGKSADSVESLSVSEDILQMSEDAKTAMTKEVSQGLGFVSDIINFFYNSIAAVWSGLNIMMASIGLAQGVVTDITTVMHMPLWVSGLVVTAIILVVIFAFGRAVLKTDL